MFNNFDIEIIKQFDINAFGSGELNSIEKQKLFLQPKIMKLINNTFQNEIKKLIPNDSELKYNGKVYPKHQLFLSHLISDYYEAYLKSSDNEKKNRTNTLESLGKGNEKRKRYFKNKDILKNKKSTKENF